MTEVLVCKDGEMADGGVRMVKAGTVEIGVIRHKGQYYAYRNLCPHQGGPACEGLLMAKVGLVLSFFMRARASRRASWLALTAIVAAAGFAVVLMLEMVFRVNVN